MQSLQDVYNRMQEKQRQYKEIARSFQDELKASPRYAEIVEQMKRLREEKKSLENQVKAAAMLDATKMDTLKLDITSDKETLSDIALTMVTDGEEVAIVDRDQSKWVPLFSVRFKKAEEGETVAQVKQEIAASMNEAEAKRASDAAEEAEEKEEEPAMAEA